MVLSTRPFLTSCRRESPSASQAAQSQAAVEAGGGKDHTAAPAMRPVESDGGKAGETFSALGIREAQMNENN